MSETTTKAVYKLPVGSMCNNSTEAHSRSSNQVFKEIDELEKIYNKSVLESSAHEPEHRVHESCCHCILQ